MVKKTKRNGFGTFFWTIGGSIAALVAGHFLIKYLENKGAADERKSIIDDLVGRNTETEEAEELIQ